MPRYEYRCEAGHETVWDLTIAEYEELTNDDLLCAHSLEDVEWYCLKSLKRIFSFSTKPSMPEHFNQSAGEYVSNERQLNDAFKRQSDAATARTGVEHKFTAVDPQDKKTLGVTDAGLAETYDRRKRLGMRIPDVIKPGNMT